MKTPSLVHCRKAAPSFGAPRRPSFATRSVAMSLRRAAALVIAALAASAASAAAPITLAPMFRDHAVLQRDVPLPIWGTAEPGAEIRAFFFYGDGSDAPSYSAVADADGRWRVVFPAQPAGGVGVLAGKQGQQLFEQTFYSFLLPCPQEILELSHHKQKFYHWKALLP